MESSKVRESNSFMDFNRKNIETALAKLTPDMKPKWGMMTPQHMVEHLTNQFRYAIGEKTIEIKTPAERIQEMQDSLYTTKPMTRNAKALQLPKDRLFDLEYANLEEAKKSLLEYYDDYENYFKENPDAVTANVAFGMLGKELWDLLNRKHFAHHFGQFGL